MNKTILAAAILLSLNANAAQDNIVCQPVENYNNCHVLLTENLDNMDDHLNLIQLLYAAGPNDVITIHINGPGGYIDILQSIIGAMDASKAKVITEVRYMALSADAIILLHGKEMIIDDNALILFHRSSLFGQETKVCDRYEGKLDRTKDFKEKCLKMNKMLLEQDRLNMIRDVKKVLTKTEIMLLLEGEDIILTGKELKERLK